MTSHVGILQRIALALLVVFVAVCVATYHFAFNGRSAGSANYSANIVRLTR